MVTAKHPPSGPGSGKIDHVVIIVKENHCFDNYFGTFPGANGMTNAEVAQSAASGPGPSAQRLASSAGDFCPPTVR